MNITDVTRLAGREKRRKRIGRGKGSGSGKTSGRGHKGSGQRAGWKQRGMQEGGQMPVFRRLPKRGFNNAQFETRYAIVNVASLEERFDAGAHVTAQSLMEVGLIRNLNLPVKILGDGQLTKKFTIDAVKYSKSAEQKIKSAGGSINSSQ